MGDRLQEKYAIYAGFGKAEFSLPEALFPAEQYVGVHDAISVRAAVLKAVPLKTPEPARQADGDICAIVSFEIPSIRNPKVLAACKALAAGLSGADEDLVWICTTHNMTTIHIPPEEEQDRFELYRRSMMQALGSAMEQACRLRRSSVGCASGNLYLNTSRDIRTNQGWWMGLNGESVCDRTLTELLFCDEEGKPIGVLYHYPMKPWAANEATEPDGTRYSSSEVCGRASRTVEERLGAPALFFMGAAADMVPKKKAFYSEADRDGNRTDVNLGPEVGFAYAAEQGEALGEAVVRLAAETRTETCVYFHQDLLHLRYDGQKNYSLGQPYRPTPDYTYEPAEPETLDVNVLCLDRCVLMGMAPESTAVLGIELREAAAPVRVLLCSLVNGGKYYLADSLSYDRCTFSAVHSVFARGSGERFVRDAAAYIRKLYGCPAKRSEPKQLYEKEGRT